VGSSGSLEPHWRSIPGYQKRLLFIVAELLHPYHHHHHHHHHHHSLSESSGIEWRIDQGDDWRQCLFTMCPSFDDGTIHQPETTDMSFKHSMRSLRFQRSRFDFFYIQCHPSLTNVSEVRPFSAIVRSQRVTWKARHGMNLLSRAFFFSPSSDLDCFPDHRSTRASNRSLHGSHPSPRRPSRNTRRESRWIWCDFWLWVGVYGCCGRRVGRVGNDNLSRFTPFFVIKRK